MAVVSHRSPGSRTFQPTDLAHGDRRVFLDEAKTGLARLRDGDGSSLVMLPEAQLTALRDLRTHFVAYLSLENALHRSREERRPTDFGHLAWADRLDDEDLEEFRQELRDALTRAATAEDVGAVDEVIRAWKLTAELLGDPEATARINTEPSPAEYDTLDRPGADG